LEKERKEKKQKKKKRKEPWVANVPVLVAKNSLVRAWPPNERKKEQSLRQKTGKKNGGGAKRGGAPPTGGTLREKKPGPKLRWGKRREVMGAEGWGGA